VPSTRVSYDIHLLHVTLSELLEPVLPIVHAGA